MRDNPSITPPRERRNRARAWVSVLDAAKVLDMLPSDVASLVRGRHLVARFVAGRCLIRASSLQSYLRHHPRSPARVRSAPTGGQRGWSPRRGRQLSLFGEAA